MSAPIHERADPIVPRKDYAHAEEGAMSAPIPEDVVRVITELQVKVRRQLVRLTIWLCIASGLVGYVIGRLT
jgi:hypothetical protein